MHAGRFIQVGPPRAVYHHPATRRVAESVGASNVLDASVVRRWLSPPAGPSTASVLIRPERIGLSRASAPGALAGHVIRVAFLGATLECEVAVDGRTLLVHAPGSRETADLGPGASVWLSIAGGDVVPLAEDPA
jgi:ABC-type Fe3+/spermidine/putrescine transport system ATPase subunit